MCRCGPVVRLHPAVRVKGFGLGSMLPEPLPRTLRDHLIAAVAGRDGLWELSRIEVPPGGFGWRAASG